VFANCYKSARNTERPVDYVHMSNTCHFNSFKGYPQLLADMEGDIVRELKEAFTEQRAIEVRGREKPLQSWRRSSRDCMGSTNSKLLRLKPTCRS